MPYNIPNVNVIQSPDHDIRQETVSPPDPLVVVGQKGLQDGHIVDGPAHYVQHLGDPNLVNCHTLHPWAHRLGAKHAVDKFDLPLLLPEFVCILSEQQR